MQEELDAWTRELEEDLAWVHDLSAQAKAAKRVVDLQWELINIVCPSWYTMVYHESGYLLTIFLRVAVQHVTTYTYSSLPVLSTTIAMKCRLCPALAWVQ